MSNLELYKSTEYQYQLSSDYLTEANEAIINYANVTSLSIKYWHIEVQESLNINDIRQQQNFNNYVFDIYHMVPTMDIQQLTYQIGFEAQSQGTSNIGGGSLTLFLIKEPLPGDLFTFYNSDEIFRVQDVRWHRTQSDHLQCYNIDFETAPMLESTKEQLRINENWYWDNERKKFLSGDFYDDFNTMVTKRKSLVKEINKSYNSRYSTYGLCPSDATTRFKSPVFLESILVNLKHLFRDSRLKIQSGPFIKINKEAIDEYFIQEDPTDLNSDLENPEVLNLKELGLIDLFNKTKELYLMTEPFIDWGDINTSKKILPFEKFLPEEVDDTDDTENFKIEAPIETSLKTSKKINGLLDVYLWMDNITGVHYSTQNQEVDVFDGRKR